MKNNDRLLPERYAYVARFTPYHDEGDYWVVRFPNLEGCRTNADTLEEAIEQAHNILEDYMALLERDGHPISKPTPYDKIRPQEGEIVQLIVVPMASARRRWDESYVKKTLTLPRWLDEMGQQAGFNFSQVLQEGLRERLHIR